MKLVALALLAACGDNVPAAGPLVLPASTLFVSAHAGDDLAFMQPQLLDAIQSGGVAAIYFGSLTDAKPGFERAAGAHAWECGYVLQAAPVEHCRLIDRDVALIGLDLPVGDEGDDDQALVKLAQGGELDIDGVVGGTATKDSVASTLDKLLMSIAPHDVHALDLAGTHGDDHSAHVMSAAFLMWGTSRSGLGARIAFHRGDNVADEAPNLSDADYAAAAVMLPPFADDDHQTWLRRQYGYARRATVQGKLSQDGKCLGVASGVVAMIDCAAAPQFLLDASGALSTGGACLAASDAGVAAATCNGDISERWWMDSEGAIWSASPPSDPTLGDHLRCLAGASTATCGVDLHPVWTLE